jgi:hypothetical protein
VLLFFGYERRKSEDGTGYIPFTAADCQKEKVYTLYENPLHGKCWLSAMVNSDFS